MYLLMLLATYVSAIYGYNLSARVDYDRDIVRKKAMSMLYRFNYQSYVSNKLLYKIEIERAVDGHDYSLGILPQDMMYAASDSELTYAQGSDEETFVLRSSGETGSSHDLHMLPEGRNLYGADEMMSKIYCLPLNETTHKYYDLNDYKDASQGGYTSTTPTPEDGEEPEGPVDEPPSSVDCVSTRDEDGNITKSCCDSSAHRYLISFRRMDARWINRITNGITFDFQRALIEYPFSANIGFVYYKNNHWHFEGRIKLLPAYVDEMNAWEAEHLNDPDESLRQFPTKMRNKTTWELPGNFFDENFFRVNGHDYCRDTGCLFKIRKI